MSNRKEKYHRVLIFLLWSNDSWLVNVIMLE